MSRPGTKLRSAEWKARISAGMKRWHPGPKARKNSPGTAERATSHDRRQDKLKTEMGKTRNGGKSDLMDTLIAYWWKDMFKPYDRDPAEIQWT